MCLRKENPQHKDTICTVCPSGKQDLNMLFTGVSVDSLVTTQLGVRTVWLHLHKSSCPAHAHEPAPQGPDEEAAGEGGAGGQNIQMALPNKVPDHQLYTSL